MLQEKRALENNATLMLCWCYFNATKVLD